MFTKLRKSLFRRTFLRLWLDLRSFKLRKRHTLKIIIALMSLNILISISILKQQSNLTTVFDTYFNSLKYKYDNKELLKLLNSYRSMFKMSMFKKKLNNNNNNNNNKNHGKSSIIEVDDLDRGKLVSDKIEDYYFHRNLIDDLRTNRQTTDKKFYEPRVMIENKQACQPIDDDQTAPNAGRRRRSSLFMICLIHSPSE